MAVERMSVVLMVVSPWPRTFDVLKLAPLRLSEESYKHNDHQTSICLAAFDASEFGAGEAELRRRQVEWRSIFPKAAEWLDQRPPSVFADLRARGFTTEVWLFVDMTDDQCEFHASPHFLRACGDRELPFNMITND